MTQMFGYRHLYGGGVLPRPMEFTNFTLNASTGTQDITLSDSLGKNQTPIAAMFVVTKTTAASANGAGFSIGVFDGTNEWVNAFQDEHGVGTTNPQTRAATDECIMVLDTDGTVLVEANGSALIQNGAQINIGATDTNQYHGVAFFWFSQSGSAVAGTFDPHDTQNSSVTVSPGISPDVVLSVAVRNGFDDTGRQDGSRMTFGVSANGGNQVSQFFVSVEAQADSDIRSETHSNRAVPIDATTTLEYGSFTSTGFDATTRDGNAEAANRIGYLAINIPNTHYQCGVIDTPTATGNLDTTSDAKESVMVITATTESVGSVETNDNAECFGIGAGSETGLVSVLMACEDSQGTSDTESLFDADGITATGADSNDIVVSESFSEISTGFRLGFPNTVHTAAKKWPYLAMGNK